MRQTGPTRGLPTSRAYWELKAEQMMNRVFAPEEAIDLESRDPAPHRPLPPASPPGPKVLHTTAAGQGTGSPKAAAPAPLTVLLLASLGGVCLVGALGALLLMQQWAGLQRSVSQERNLLLVERLRSLGPASDAAAPPAPATPLAPVLDPIQAASPQALTQEQTLPPPPPEEPWMTQLSQLPPTPAPSGRPALLRVPMSQRLTAPAPAAQAVPRTTGPLPQLVGLVGAPGRAGSAIFQVGETSANVNVGEPIGNSGWSLRAADAESALIERGAEVRRISIGTGG